MLLDNEGRWVEGKVELKSWSMEFYSKLFTSNAGKQSSHISGQFPCSEEVQYEVWEAEVTMAEMKKALSEMGP